MSIFRAFIPLLVLAGAAFALRARSSSQVGNRNVPEPAKPVDIDRYLGTWFEIARYENRFEEGCEAATTEYSRGEDGEIRVINRCREGGLDGTAIETEGRAHVIEGSDNAKLEVSFFGPFYAGDYWILDHDDDYAWAIVGEPSGRYLWILSRTNSPSSEERQQLRIRAAELGYDLHLLRPTRHRVQ